MGSAKGALGLINSGAWDDYLSVLALDPGQLDAHEPAPCRLIHPVLNAPVNPILVHVAGILASKGQVSVVRRARSSTPTLRALPLFVSSHMLWINVGL
jgi:hypothetical protein